jgi:hypothetical protein
MHFFKGRIRRVRLAPVVDHRETPPLKKHRHR